MTVDDPMIFSARRGLGVRAALAGGGVLVAVGVFAAIAHLVGEQDAVVVDGGVLAEAVEHRRGVFTGFFEAVSTAAEIPLAVLVAVLAGVFAWRQRSWAPVVLAGLAAAGSTALATLVKEVAGRARPDVLWQVLPETGFSFPSRHTTVAAALLLVTAYLLAHHARTLPAMLAWWACALVLVGLVAASRVYLGVHWATDVTAAFSLGAAWALILIGAHLLLRLRHLGASTPTGSGT